MSVRISPWLRASLQGTTLLGAVMIALVWVATTAYLESARQADLKAATQEASNLARAFEEHIARTVRGTDNTLVILRAMYETDSKSFGFVDWSSEIHRTNDAVLHYSIVDAAGRLIESSRKPVEPLDLSNREHYRVQKNAAADELFIGKVADGIRTGKSTIQLTRRLRGGDGSFAGEIVASLDTELLIKFYQTIDIGHEGSISLVGLDGHIRARRGFKLENISHLPAHRGVFARLEKAQSGSYMNDGQFDGVKRLIAYRKVAGFPLLVVVGLAEHEILAKYRANQVTYYTLAAGMTLIVLIVMALSILHHRRLEQVYDSLRMNEGNLRASRQELKTTLDNIDQGILMADALGNIAVVNRRLIELLDLPQEWLTKRTTTPEILSFLTKRGEYGENGKLLDKAVWEIIRKGGLSNHMRSYERTRPDGRVLEIRARPLPDGGTVRTFTDITERKHAEMKIAEMASHDDLTGLANRKLFRDEIHRALSRSQRHGEGFAVLLFDLDRFKEINDTRGHPAGDAVLKEAALRLAACVREEDLAARLGGDEFAILQTRAGTDEDAGLLAERIIEAIRVPFHLDGEEIDIATSIGIALAPRDGTNYEQLVKRADEALYRAKEVGGNLFCFYRPDFTTQNKSEDVFDLARAAS
jgi:diguanylate cyclase (GGDEF)-like protein